MRNERFLGKQYADFRRRLEDEAKRRRRLQTNKPMEEGRERPIPSRTGDRSTRSLLEKAGGAAEP